MPACHHGCSLLRRAFGVVGLLFVAGAIRFISPQLDSVIELNKIKSYAGHVLSSPYPAELWRVKPEPLRHPLPQTGHIHFFPCNPLLNLGSPSTQIEPQRRPLGPWGNLPQRSRGRFSRHTGFSCKGRPWRRRGSPPRRPSGWRGHPWRRRCQHPRPLDDYWRLNWHSRV